MNNLICEAIKTKTILKLTYKNITRTCEPHLLGYDSTNDLTLSAWQLTGKGEAGWRDYHISNTSDISVTGKNFASARKGYSRRDKTIVRVICSL